MLCLLLLLLLSLLLLIFLLLLLLVLLELLLLFLLLLLFEGDQLPEGWFSSISTADTSLTALAAKWTRDFLKDRHDAEESLETLLNKNICKETAKANQVKNKAK